jgi:hypothetical protein
MTLESITGTEDINNALNSALYATLATLEKEGYITKDQQTEFLDTHFAVKVGNRSGFQKWFKRLFKSDASDMVIVVKTFVAQEND